MCIFDSTNSQSHLKFTAPRQNLWLIARIQILMFTLNFLTKTTDIFKHRLNNSALLVVVKDSIVRISVFLST